MIAFENYLLNNGWSIDNLGDTRGLSTMGRLYARYVKGDQVIICGLNEKGMPPTLIHPRPRAHRKEEEGSNFIYHEIRDAQINRILSDVPFDVILKSMFDRTPMFEFNENGNFKTKHL